MRKNVLLVTLIFMLLVGCAPKKNEPPVIFVDNNAPQFTNPATFDVKVIGYSVTEETRREIGQLLTEEIKRRLSSKNPALIDAQGAKKYVILVKITNYLEPSKTSQATATAGAWVDFITSLAGAGATSNGAYNSKQFESSVAYLETATYICDVQKVNNEEYIGNKIAHIPYRADAKASMFGMDYLKDSVSSTAGHIVNVIYDTLVNKKG